MPGFATPIALHVPLLGSFIEAVAGRDCQVAAHSKRSPAWGLMRAMERVVPELAPKLFTPVTAAGYIGKARATASTAVYCQGEALGGCSAHTVLL